MFALGEVTYLYADRIIKYSIALAMLICLVILSVKKPKYIKKYVFLGLFFVGGFSYIFFRDSISPITYNESKTVTEKYDMDGFIVTTQTKQSERNFYIEASGTITGVEVGEKGSNLIIKFGSGVWSYKVVVYEGEKTYRLGDRVYVVGIISSIESGTNLGCMNMNNYYRARGILFNGQGDKLHIEKIAEGKRNVVLKTYYFMVNVLVDVKNSLSKQIDNIAEEDTAAFFKGILLGDKAYMDIRTSKLYRVSGIAHILTISGLHISLIGGVLFKVMVAFGTGHTVAAVASIICVVFYGGMSGFGFATIRAIIMLTISMIGYRLSREYDMVTSMSLALIIMLLIEPFRICDGGIWLSYGAVAGVIMGKYIIRILNRNSKIKKLRRKAYFLYKIISGVVLSLSVNVVILPIIANMYYEIPLYSIVTNLLIVPVMGVVLVLGILGVLLSYISVIWGWLIYIPAGVVIKYITYLCQLMMKLPYASLNCGNISVLSVILYYLALGIILIILKPKIQRKVRQCIYKRFGIWLDYHWWGKAVFCFALLVVSSVSISIFVVEGNRNSKVVYFADVGQGDGILIKEDGVSIVIDGGSTSNENLGEYVMEPLLKYFRMSTVEYWYISHFDKDHISGLIYILDYGDLTGIKIKNLVVPRYGVGGEEIIEKARRKEINIIYMEPGDVIKTKIGKMTCVAPFFQVQYEDSNQASMALVYKRGTVGFLFTGDMGKEGLDALVERNGNLVEDIDVLKVPHHGSKNSISEIFYQQIKPEVAVISCGKNNLYGHPHRDTLAMLESVGGKVFRTDMSGYIKIEFVH